MFFKTVTAKVVKLIPDGDKVVIKIISGAHKNQLTTISDFDNETKNNFNVSNISKKAGLKISNEVMVSINENPNDTIKNAEIFDYVRYKYLYIVSLFFTALLIILGGRSIFKSLTTLVLTGIAIIK